MKGRLGGLVQARCLKNGMSIIGMSNGANVEGTKGEHCVLAPAYNVTKEEVETIADIFAKSVEECITEAKVVA